MNAMLSRRSLLAGVGALVVAFEVRAQEAPGKLPGSLSVEPRLAGWVQVAPDGAVTVFTGKAELGQGIKTALIQVAAEQLYLAPDQVSMVTADTYRTANEGYTAGSHSMQDSGTAIMNAAAEVRGILVAEAASRLGVDPAALTPVYGRMTAADGRSLGYGELVGGLTPDRLAQPGAPLKDPAAFTVIGKPVPRVDIPAKVTGGQAYVQDMSLPGMLHARMVRPPRYGAVLASLDEASVAAMPGVVKIVRDGNFVGVLAQGEWQAIVAMRALANGARWTGGTALPDQATIFDTIQALPAQDSVILDRKAEQPATSRRLKARYLRPYGMHGSIGPSCAVAQWQDGTMTVWTHTQGVYPMRDALAELLALPKDKVHCIHTEGSGCYGHNGADDVGADAALLARAVPGRPVRVQWMREQENTCEPFTPAIITEVEAALDANWAHRGLAVRRVEQHAQHAPGQCRPDAGGAVAGQPAAALAAAAHPTTGGRRRPQRHPAVRPASGARGVALHPGHAAARVRDARARRLHQRVQHRKLHGRAGRGGWAGPGSVPAGASVRQPRTGRRDPGRERIRLGRCFHAAAGSRPRLRVRPLQEPRRLLRSRARGRRRPRDRPGAGGARALCGR